MEDKLLESKSYFKKGIEWYCYRYLFCITEKSWLVLIMFALLACFCSLLLNIYVLFPIKRDLKFVRYVNHSDNEFYIIRTLSQSKKENEHVAIARYLIEKYIEIYESSAMDQKDFVRNNSTHKVYRDYKEKINNVAPTQKKKVINTNVMALSIDLSNVNSVNFAGSATAIFTVNKTHDQIVEINFTVSNIHATIKGITPFKFMVNNYRLK
ncbi:MAG: VirB8/TrbF family protein [Wolbachia endosymbiont of Tyrophagus putrescentiae]|nr:VirB8/TrbF family protein [Wolbachia endosymbiont of Tyrophagus putrescentiae]